MAGTDYLAASGTLSFSPGTTTQTITVIVNGDPLVETDEFFFVNLIDPVAAVLDDSRGQATILNDDGTSTATNSTLLGGDGNDTVVGSDSDDSSRARADLTGPGAAGVYAERSAGSRR